MNSGHTIFAQLMDIIPQHRFRQHVQRYRAEKGVRKLFCKAQFQALAFTQLTGRDSLRSIEIGLNSFGNGLYHMGFRSPKSRKFWNRIPDVIKEKVVDIALDYPDKSPRQLAWHITDSERYFISESSVFRILKSYDLITSPAFIVMSAKDKFQHPAKYINEFWQTDSPISRSSAGAGTFCPPCWTTIPGISSPVPKGWLCQKLFSTMSVDDVKETLDQALSKTGVRQVKVKRRPRLLLDNGLCYISKELGDYLDKLQIRHTRGAPYHSMTKGKIERYHRSLKNVINLDNYYFPLELEREITKFIDYYNHEQYHESLDNLTPADVYYGRGRMILDQRELIKRSTYRRECDLISGGYWRKV